MAEFKDATGSYDRSKLTHEQLKALEEAEKTLREKAYAGTLTEKEKNAIRDRACGVLGMTQSGTSISKQEKILQGYKFLESLFKISTDIGDNLSRLLDILYNSIEFDFSTGVGLGSSAGIFGEKVSLYGSLNPFSARLESGEWQYGVRYFVEGGGAFIGEQVGIKGTLGVFHPYNCNCGYHGHVLEYIEQAPPNCKSMVDLNDFVFGIEGISKDSVEIVSFALYPGVGLSVDLKLNYKDFVEGIIEWTKEGTN